MRLCKPAEKTGNQIKFTVEASRVNACNLMWGFLRAWWNGDDSFNLTIYNEQPQRIFWNDQQVSGPPPDAQPENGGAGK